MKYTVASMAWQGGSKMVLRWGREVVHGLVLATSDGRWSLVGRHWGGGWKGIRDEVAVETYSNVYSWEYYVLLHSTSQGH